MRWWTKFGCFLTGWNSRILAGCSEASFKHLKKYTSALLILIILWAFTGYCFADRYIGAPWWGCVIMALIFVIIIIQTPICLAQKFVGITCFISVDQGNRIKYPSSF